MLVVRILCCLHKALCGGLLLCNMIVEKLSHCVHETGVVKCYLSNGEAIVLSAQGLCSGLLFYHLAAVKLSHFLCEAFVVAMLLCCLHNDLHSRLLFCNMVVVKLSCCMCEALCCGDDLALYVQ